MRFIVEVNTPDPLAWIGGHAPASPSELYDFFYGVSDGQIEANITVRVDSVGPAGDDGSEDDGQNCSDERARRHYRDNRPDMGEE